MTKNHLHRGGLACAAAIAWAALAGNASAQVTAAQQSAIRSNCRSDFMSQCSGVTPGGKDALVCLQKNVERLSPGCQAAVHATIPSQAAAPPPPPAAAVAAPAASAPPALTPATADTAPALSPPAAAPAKTAAPPAKVVKPAPMRPAAAAAAPIAPPAAGPSAPTAAQQNAMRSNCRNDFMSHCAGVTPGGKDALACLQKNVARLSPGCRSVVSATMHAPAAEAAMPAAAEPAEPPAAMERAEPAAREGFVPGGILINKACARYMLMQCPGMAMDMGRKVACLADYVKAGHFVGPRCRAALEVSGHLR